MGTWEHHVSVFNADHTVDLYVNGVHIETTPAPIEEPPVA